MARRRFSTLNKFPLLQAPYTQYKAWQDRTTPTNYTRSASSNPGGYVRQMITPFGGPSAQKLIIKVSKRANDHLETLLTTHVAEPDATGLRLPGFEPARAVVFRGTGGATAETSKITGVSYQKRAGVTYTHGFGAKSATEREVEAQNEIAAAVAATANSSVSFTPERFYQV